MKETILSGLILAFISGITILAFKHKIVFDKVFNKLFIIAVSVPSVLMLWNIAIEYSFSQTLYYIEKEKIQLAKESLPYFPLSNNYLFIILLAIQVYLYGLSYLANLIEENDKK